jgi:hypothetical protein
MFFEGFTLDTRVVDGHAVRFRQGGAGPRRAAAARQPADACDVAPRGARLLAGAFT